MASSVEESWSTITGWLAERLPAAVDELFKPATSVDLDAVEAAIGAALPVELRTWYRLNNGMSQRGSFGRLLPPGYNPIACDRIVKSWRLWKFVDASRALDASVREAEAAGPAGGDTTRFLPVFVPFAENGVGQNLVVDLRDGPARGCVARLNPGNGGLAGGPLWPGVGAMLTDVAQSLESGGPALQSRDGIGPAKPDLRDGFSLNWA